MSAAEYEEMTEDMRAKGMKDDIELLGDLILDGRNRYEICKLIGIKPRFRHLPKDTEPVGHVISKGVRRNLTPSQKAMQGQRVLDYERAEAAKRQEASQFIDGKKPNEIVGATVGTTLSPPSGKATAIAAKKVGSSSTNVKKADKVVKKGSQELQDAVNKGELTLNKVMPVLDLPKEEQLDAAKSKPKHPVRSTKSESKRKEKESDESSPVVEEADMPADPRDIARAALRKSDHRDMLEVTLEAFGSLTEQVSYLESHHPDLVQALVASYLAKHPVVQPALIAEPAVADPVTRSMLLFSECNKKEKLEVLNNIKKLWDTSQKPSLYDELFEPFWEVFPDLRKRGKGEAFEAWKKAVARLRTLDPWKHDCTVEEYLTKRAGDYAASDVGKGEFVKGPTPWLNQNSWDDGAAAWSESKGAASKTQDPYVYPESPDLKPSICPVKAAKAARLPTLKEDE